MAAALQKRVPVPGRIRGNMWAVAQYIESRRHRRTLKKLMADIFAAQPCPSGFHRFLAGLPLGLVIDSWYDGTLAAAMAGADRADVIDMQGITRAGIGEDRWYRAFDLAGRPAEPDGVRTLALHAAWWRSAGWRCAGFRQRLCRGPDGDRHTDADSGNGADTTDDARLPVFRLSLPRPDAAHLRQTACQAHPLVRMPAWREVDSLSVNERRFLAAEGITLIDVPLAEATQLLAG